MLIDLSEERSWETGSGMPHESARDPMCEWSSEVDAPHSGHSEEDEDSEEFLSPDWD